VWTIYESVNIVGSDEKLAGPLTALEMKVRRSQNLTFSLSFIRFKMLHIYRIQKKKERGEMTVTSHCCLLNKAYRLSYQTKLKYKRNIQHSTTATTLNLTFPLFEI